MSNMYKVVLCTLLSFLICMEIKGYLDKPLKDSPSSGYEIEYMDARTGEVQEHFVPVDVIVDGHEQDEKPLKDVRYEEGTFKDDYIGGRYASESTYAD